MNRDLPCSTHYKITSAVTPRETSPVATRGLQAELRPEAIRTDSRQKETEARPALPPLEGGPGSALLLLILPSLRPETRGTHRKRREGPTPRSTANRGETMNIRQKLSALGRQMRRHPGLVPLIGFTGLGIGNAAIYLMRLTLFNPDISWIKKDNQEPWNNLGPNP
ncbi:hypothetical protein NDU88_000839 [Pleurodeles waltl]|uniref:NADH dehydrogenase [ubiquinone] 1 alpha subcomplex subunit 4-like 2 n=1 Tax=Pleurodeles waltl TaxID=8319 RepID=A0AAV7S840_PLEWA|nr:hypothetical protein NDU88_000839 [Pleurodeles waltl]